MGSGKTSAARLAATRLGAIVVRTDAVRKRLGGVPLHERIAAGFGTGLYAPEMGRRTYAEAARLADELLRASWPVIVDGSFSHVAERDALRAVAVRHRVPFAVLWCDAPDEVLLERLRTRAQDRREVSDGGEELLAVHRGGYEPPTREPGVTCLSTTSALDEAVEEAIRRLAAPP